MVVTTHHNMGHAVAGPVNSISHRHLVLAQADMIIRS